MMNLKVAAIAASPVTYVLGLSAIGAICIVAGVAVLAGAGWCLIASGIFLLASAGYITKGLSANG